jgi:hypothetical protein
MLGLKRRQQPQEETSVAQTAVIIPFPSAKVPERMAEPDKQRSYEELAAQLGFKPQQLVKAQLVAFCSEQNIKLYDNDEVWKYLTSKKQGANVERWCWRPLREKDHLEFRWGCNTSGEPTGDGFYNAKKFECRQYDKLVPMHALEKALLIETKFGDDVRLFVSDWARPDCDPFIAAVCKQPWPDNSGWGQIIFDVWNEPGFGDEKK